ncbi:VWA domain-containing protein [Maritimibacter sp. UBA3975]|uniref:nitric oxide reductase activation protein NorD n=1 Tax=Maritimibacter sp. UBA3975 TaxID=1946833 RepID=UPI000C09A0D3|nr:VWA domain-containing protein [Maritimibacter sp. UBA3975]MAM59929.1 NorD nitric oxide reductase activation protein [Maritimibacter sp.]
MKMLDFLEPEEAVGTLWHGMVTRSEADATHAGCAVELEAVRASVAALYRALGGGQGVEIGPAPATPSAHRITGARRIGAPRIHEHVAGFDGDRLALPPVMDVFPDARLNRAAYLWLAALAAFVDLPPRLTDPLAADRAEIGAIAIAADRAYAACPGLRAPYGAMCDHLITTRARAGLPQCEAGVEQLILDQLSGRLSEEECLDCPAPRGYRGFAPVPIWLRLTHRAPGKGAANDDAEPGDPAPEMKGRKAGKREDRDQADRRDSFIVHRFEAILSWAESLNLNRMVEDDDDENAQKAADDQDEITLSQNSKRAATRLRLSLDLSPQDADHERLAGTFTYPEWNRRTGAYMPDHARVLEAPAVPAEGYRPDPRLVARVKRQFAPLNPRRVILPRQLDGDDLDLDALVASRADIVAGREGSDRIWQSARPMARDLSVAILMDCSRSTEAHLGDRSVIDVAREALAALGAGIDTAGDRLGIWGFSSLRRDRVFLSKAKDFDEPMGADVTARIGGFRPGHYTRLGAAIRHASAQLAQEGATRRLLLVLTDGKPNDLDHYEGQHGIEDSRMAVREAHALGQAVHGVIIDADGQDWFARIFGRAGFTLLPHADRLPRALPDIYQTLTQET